MTKARLVSICTSLLTLLSQEARPQQSAQNDWVATWSASQDLAPGHAAGRPLALPAGTVRYRVTVSAGGSRLRVHVCNELNAVPLKIGGASIALAQSQGAQLGTVRRVTFAGRAVVDVAGGARAVSDAVDLPVSTLSSLLISLYLPGGAVGASDFDELYSSQFVKRRDETASEQPLRRKPAEATRPLICAIEVIPAEPTRTVVTLGGSITEGVGSKQGAAGGWTALLAQRLTERKAGPARAVANAGMSGNALLPIYGGPTGLARLDRDVLSLAGARYLVVMMGMNDIGSGGLTLDGKTYPQLTAEQLTQGYEQLIARAHARGIKVIGATLTPFGGAGDYSTPAKEATRQKVNGWIRDSGAFDAVVDFDAVVRDPAEPSRLKREYDSGDSLHPNDAGHRAIAAAFDLSVFD